MYSKHCRTDKKGRHPQSQPVGHRRKSFSGVLQCCRIKMSIVSNKRRSVVLHDIVMIVHHHQQRLAHNNEEPHTEVSSSRTKSLLQPLTQLHQRSIAHEAYEEPGLEHPQWDGDCVLMEKRGDEEDHCDRSATRPACCKKGFVQVPEEPSMYRQIPVLPKL